MMVPFWVPSCLCHWFACLSCYFQSLMTPLMILCLPIKVFLQMDLHLWKYWTNINKLAESIVDYCITRVMATNETGRFLLIKFPFVNHELSLVIFRLVICTIKSYKVLWIFPISLQMCFTDSFGCCCLYFSKRLYHSLWNLGSIALVLSLSKMS